MLISFEKCKEKKKSKHYTAGNINAEVRIIMEGGHILSCHFCASCLGEGGEKLMLSKSCEIHVSVLLLLIFISNLQLHSICKFSSSSKHLSRVSPEYSLSEIKCNFP